MRRGTIGATVVGIVAALTGAAFAGTFPTRSPDRPIKVVVPAAAGGVTDAPARIVTNRMRDNLGQTLVIENQGGAGGILAAESVKRAAPDGYTLLYVNAATHGLLPHEEVAALRCDGRISCPSRWRCGRRWQSWSAVNRRTRHWPTWRRAPAENPKPLNYGSPGPGNTSHLIGLMLAQASKTPMQAVHYRGEAPMIQDLISGHVDFAASNIIRSHVEAGTLRVLATTRRKTLVRLPGCADAQGIGLHR